MPIFRPGPMCSIRRTLLCWLVPLFLVVGVASAVVSYLTFRHTVSDFMDAQMEQIGASVAVQVQPVTPPLDSAERIHALGAYVVQVVDGRGQVVQSAWPVNVPADLAPGFHDLRLDGKRWRVYVTAARAGDGQRVRILQSADFRSHLAAARAGGTVAPIAILMVLATLTLWAVANAISRDVQAIGRKAAQQDEHSIAELPLASVPAEIAPLVESFNALLARLREAFAAQRRFMQDAAHELRTPITAVALQLENVRRDMPQGACAESLLQLQGGVSRAQRTMDQLLRMARREATGPEAPVEIDVQAQVRESIGALIALADQRHIDLGVAGEVPVPPLTLTCPRADLRNLLDNLIENAVRYTPAGGTVDVRLLREQGRPVIEVVDTGPGIPPDQLGRVFDRFYRVPGNEVAGTGLGLAIAEAAARRCGLRIVLRNRGDRSGLVARVEPQPAS